MGKLFLWNEKKPNKHMLQWITTSVPVMSWQTVDTISFVDAWMLPLRKQKDVCCYSVWHVDMNPFSMQSKTLSMWSFCYRVTNQCMNVYGTFIHAGFFLLFFLVSVHGHISSEMWKKFVTLFQLLVWKGDMSKSEAAILCIWMKMAFSLNLY